MEFIKVIPKKSLSRVVGRLAKLEKPKWMIDQAKAWFAQTYRLNMDEAEKGLADYKSLTALFTRKLKAGTRPMGEGLVHPCDGVLSQSVQIEDGQLVQAKGIHYSVAELLKDDGAEALFRGGAQLTYYLCPTDYHRVHSPVDGEVESVVHVPGELWPVNPWAVENVSQLFCRNERVVYRLRTPLGPVALVMVGATNVGDIEVSFDPQIRTNVRQARQVFRKSYRPAVAVKKGDELGIFCMGSSVVVLYPEGLISTLPNVGPVRLGESV